MIAQQAWEQLKAARAAGDELAADLAEATLNRALERIKEAA